MIQMPALPDDYPALLERLKREIGAARTRAALAVNAELIELSWRIGKEILERVFCHAYGNRLILLLGGYDKGAAQAKSRQSREIATARARLRTHQAHQTAIRKTWGVLIC